MNLDFSDNLELKFQIKMQKFADLSPNEAYRQRKIQVVQARESLANNNNILVKKLNTNFDEFSTSIVNDLKALNVIQYSLTRLETDPAIYQHAKGVEKEITSKVRVRLD